MTDTWEILPDVPVAVPRIAASAVTLRDTVYVLGGYSVDSTGAETTRPQVRAFDPGSASWNAPGDGTRIVIAGGTDNPYNFDGIGYDGNPSAPLGQVWSYHAPTGTVVFHPDRPDPTMDHRGFPAGDDGRLWIVGGMEAGPAVTARVSSWLPDPVTAAAKLPPPLPVITVFPNPATARARFAWSGGAAREVRIVDVTGRTVRARPFGEARGNAGIWDLRGDSGRRVPPGVYWLVARLGERTAAASVVVAD